MPLSISPEQFVLLLSVFTEDNLQLSQLLSERIDDSH